MKRSTATISLVAAAALAVGVCPAVADGATNVVANVRAMLQACASALPEGDGRQSALREFGLPQHVKPTLDALALAVSNNAELVCANIGYIATNSVERMLLLSAGWRLGEEFYLQSLSTNIDLAASGVISPNELKWFMEGHRSRRLGYVLEMRYDQPGVSNIVQRLQAFTGDTNRCEKILSGEGKAECLEFESFMSDGPEF